MNLVDLKPTRLKEIKNIELNMEVKKMYDIFDEMRNMQKRMDELFANAFGGQLMLPNKKKELTTTRSPVCDMCETENNIITTVELPGVNKEEIELNINDDSIEVKVEKKNEKEEKSEDEYEYYSSSKSFYRRLPLPKNVNPENAKATYKNGMLRIEIPKKEIQEKKRLKIE